jgi:hypothetical protein
VKIRKRRSGTLQPRPKPLVQFALVFVRRCFSV